MYADEMKNDGGFFSVSFKSQYIFIKAYLEHERKYMQMKFTKRINYQDGSGKCLSGSKDIHQMPLSVPYRFSIYPYAIAFVGIQPINIQSQHVHNI